MHFTSERSRTAFPLPTRPGPPDPRGSESTSVAVRVLDAARGRRADGDVRDNIVFLELTRA